MHPVLVSFGPFTLHTYGLFVASAFFAAIFLSLHGARKEGIDPDRMLDFAFYVTLAAILGARILFIIVEYPYFLADPIRIFKIWEGGLVFYGGFIGAVIVAILYMKRHDMPILTVGDIVAPALALGQAVGRIGCLSAGCCYGKPTLLPWGITFTDPRSLVSPDKLGIPLHPTQLYSSLGNLTLFFFLLFMSRRKKFSGQILLLYGICYPLLRSFIEIFRGDPRGSLFGGMLSTSQFISVIVFLIALTFYFKLRKGHQVSGLDK
ncbi:MAG: prolipoprotein diacylglyceryl transferase [Deltaproteobacteria bacterium]|nr:prolipoprotein diacylglyceryl transferase [Deltaproteobacteria bacterium]